jgi:hypothetical protein
VSTPTAPNRNRVAFITVRAASTQMVDGMARRTTRPEGRGETSVEQATRSKRA